MFRHQRIMKAFLPSRHRGKKKPVFLGAKKRFSSSSSDDDDGDDERVVPFFFMTAQRCAITRDGIEKKSISSFPELDNSFLISKEPLFLIKK